MVKAPTVAILVVAVGCVSCQPEVGSVSETMGKLDLFFSPGGVEHRVPSLELQERLEASNPEEREALLDRLITLARGDGGFSRPLAKVALYRYFSMPDHWPHMTERTARAMAELLREMNQLGRLEDIPTEWLDGPESSTIWAVKPRCDVRIFGETIILCEGLPPGWRTEDVSVSLDGEVIITEVGWGMPDRPVVPVNLGNYVDPPPAGQMSKHDLHVVLMVRAPNGTLIQLETRTPIEILPLKWLD